MGIKSIKVKKNVTGITSAERDVISCEELAESTKVTTEVAGDKELRLNNVERQPTPQAQEIKSQLDSHSLEHLQKTELSEVVQQISSINEEEKSRLHIILEKYVDSMILKPRKCKLFAYKFQMETDKPTVGYSRPIPFAFRPAV
jgi:hypothetical protein